MNRDQRLERASEKKVIAEEAAATQAVVDADIDTAEESTGFYTTSPEQAERIARDAVIAADEAVARQISGNGSILTPEEAERLATQAVVDTE
ncbi:hypothetical protein [Shewanella waksmanii]|uniref:hypothetical protein n=1 Tax=Shewanella waksmanii TaxID=213783 RepID=UPI003735F927